MLNNSQAVMSVSFTRRGTCARLGFTSFRRGMASNFPFSVRMYCSANDSLSFSTDSRTSASTNFWISARASSSRGTPSTGADGSRAFRSNVSRWGRCACVIASFSRNLSGNVYTESPSSSPHVMRISVFHGKELRDNKND